MSYQSENGLRTGDQKGVLYKIENQNIPLLVAAQCPKYPGKVAVSASFSPSFEGHEVEFEGGVFIKIIDVSGSMNFNPGDDSPGQIGERRIDIQREALKEFVKQIPLKAEVQLMSYSNYLIDFLRVDKNSNPTLLENNEALKKEVARFLDAMEPIHGTYPMTTI